MSHRNLNLEISGSAARPQVSGSASLRAEPADLRVQAVQTADRSLLSCNGVLTNNTKALVYELAGEVSPPRLRDRGTMGAILGKSTSELSSGITDDDRT